MNCKTAEKFLLLSLDGRLGTEDQGRLKSHLAGCSRCRDVEREYRFILGELKAGPNVEPLPYFEQRLLAKIRGKEKMAPVLVWQRLAPRFLAFSLAVLILFGTAVVLFQPQEPQDLTQVETLLFHNENPLVETASVLNQQKPEDRNMMLIFAASDDRDLSRRYRP
jgi:anti-sigma factor RsiW